jgi:NAD+ dependent glucose-6-phosphate dehydrogenase
MDLYGIDIQAIHGRPHTYRADISNLEQLWLVFKQLPAIQYVIHLAADPRHDADWQSVLVNNIHGTHNVYQAALRKGGVKRIVFASSNHTTGRYEFIDGSDEPNLHLQSELTTIDISSALRPDGHYGIGKIAGEAIARYYFDAFGIQSVCLRIGSVTESPGEPSEDRHLSTWLSHGDLVQLIERALLAEKSFPGFGIYYGVSNNTRSFWSIENARRELGYSPKDDASDHWPSKVASG